MNPIVKEKWLKALRSGEYQQGRYNLKLNTNGEVAHCCLGVLCELAKEEIPLEQECKIEQIGDTEYQYTSFGGSFSTLPFRVQTWARLKDKGQFGETSLTNLNDSGATFEQIADVIEREF